MRLNRDVPGTPTKQVRAGSAKKRLSIKKETTKVNPFAGSKTADDLRESVDAMMSQISASGLKIKQK